MDVNYFKQRLTEAGLNYINYPDNRIYWGRELIMIHHEILNFLLNEKFCAPANIKTVAHKARDKDEFLTIAEFIVAYPICSCEPLAHLLDKDLGMQMFCTRPRTGKLWFVRPKRTLIYLSQTEHNRSVKRKATEFLKTRFPTEEYARESKGCSSESPQVGPSA